MRTIARSFGEGAGTRATDDPTPRHRAARPGHCPASALRRLMTPGRTPITGGSFPKGHRDKAERPPLVIGVMRRMSGARASRCSPSATEISARAPVGEAPFRLLQSALQAAISGSARQAQKVRLRPFPEFVGAPRYRQPQIPGERGGAGRPGRAGRALDAPGRWV